MKKLFASLIILVVLSITIFSFAAFGYYEKPVTIVYLGDSIAEGLAGMSPISERERYSYYGILGIRNEYRFINYAVSGSRSRQLLSFIKRDDNGVIMSRTEIKDADIIHVSILGNDLLLNDLGKLILATAQNDSTKVDSIVEESSVYFADIVWLLRAYNPDATLFFQNVYNPVFENTWLINEHYRSELDNLGVQPSEYRDIAGILLNKINGIMSDYLEENPGEFHLMDSYTEFGRIYEQDPDRGKALISVDCVHPSFEGHAVLADLTQAKLNKLGLADKQNAVKNYKDMKKEQIERLYSQAVDVTAVKNLIDSGEDCPEVTRIYFEAIKDKLPIY
ncbi:MAG: SGNH/GDSL hydrolase family protein [Bacillota bacterium]